MAVWRKSVGPVAATVQAWSIAAWIITIRLGQRLATVSCVGNKCEEMPTVVYELKAKLQRPGKRHRADLPR